MHLEFGEYAKSLPEKAELPALDFTYGEVSHIMGEEMLKLHYTKLHQGYIDRYNKGRSQSGSSLGAPKTQAEKSLLFNLGGYINHALFWKSFSPKEEDQKKSPELARVLKESFGDRLYEDIESQLPLIMGSGWIWLMYSREEKKAFLAVTMNQDFPATGVPLLNIDLWEHSYYLQYKVDKIAYLKAVYSSLNWRYAGERLAKSMAG